MSFIFSYFEISIPCYISSITAAILPVLVEPVFASKKSCEGLEWLEGEFYIAEKGAGLCELGLLFWTSHF